MCNTTRIHTVLWFNRTYDGHTALVQSTYCTVHVRICRTCLYIKYQRWYVYNNLICIIWVWIFVTDNARKKQTYDNERGNTNRWRHIVRALEARSGYALTRSHACAAFKSLLISTRDANTPDLDYSYRRQTLNSFKTGSRSKMASLRHWMLYVCCYAAILQITAGTTDLNDLRTRSV